MSLTRTVEECASAIRARNAELRAVLHVLDTPRAPKASERAPLHGVPYVLKDTWDTAGVPTTGGSWRHRERVPSSSSRVFDAFERAGAVLLGKSNLCDMAFSPESDNHLVGRTGNPWDPTRTAGGSTGGGAAAVAAGMANFDWGSDFGGSIRMPAAFCGVAGLRLSGESWPVPDDFFPRTPALDLELHGMGPVAPTVDDCRTLMRALAPTFRAPAWSVHEERAPFHTRRVALYTPEGRSHGDWPTFVADASRALRDAGVDFSVDRKLPPPSFVDRAYDAYLCSRFDAFLATGELTLKEGLPAVLMGLLTNDRRIHKNTGVLLFGMAIARLTFFRNRAAADARVERVLHAMHDVWDQGDLVVAPVSTLPAPRHGRAAFIPGLLAFAKLGNLVDATAVSVPFGRFPDGMPRALQVMGPPGAEEAVLDLGARLERVAPAA